MSGLDGSDVPQRRPTPPPPHQNFKELLHATVIAFDSLDEASVAMLQHDGDYRSEVLRLLSPLPERTTPVLSGTPRRLFQALPSAPVKAKQNFRKVLKQNQGTVEAVWLHLLSGSWTEEFNVDHLAGQLNAKLRVLHPTYGSISATPVPRRLRVPRQSTKGDAIVDVWMTKDRLAVTIAFRTHIHNQSEVLEAVDAISDSIVNKTAAVLTRNDGANSAGFRLRSPDDDPFAIDHLMRTHKAAVLKQIEEYLMRKWGGTLLKIGDMRPLVDPTSTDECHHCFFLACIGPFGLMVKIAAAPPDVFRVVVETRDTPFTSQVQTYEILIDGFFCKDSYNFL